MAEKSGIAWTNSTFNPWRGCQHATDDAGNFHPGCENCYAELMSGRNPTVLGEWGTEAEGGKRVRAAPAYWNEPLKWNKAAEKAGERRRVFCASLADVFEDWKGPILNHEDTVLWRCYKCGHVISSSANKMCGCPSNGSLGTYSCMTMDDLRRDMFALIDRTPWLTWLLLTKRPENVRRMWPVWDEDAPKEHAGKPAHLSNVWLGTSISDQRTADVWIPRLLECRDLCPVLWLSAEPLLGPIDLSKWLRPHSEGEWMNAVECGLPWSQRIKWVITGCESNGPKAGRFQDGYEAAARSIHEQCRAAGVAVFEKQMPIGGKVSKNTAEWPADLRTQEFPRP